MKRKVLKDQKRKEKIYNFYYYIQKKIKYLYLCFKIIK